MVTKFVGKKENFLSNGAKKQALIQLIMERMRQNGCNVIQAEGDADVEITKATINMSAFRPTTLIGKHRSSCSLTLPCRCFKSVELYFRSDNAISHVYNIKVLKQVLGKAVCYDLLFLLPLLDATGYLGLERKWFSNESSRKGNERLFKSLLYTKAKSRCGGNQRLCSDGSIVQC